MNYRYAIWLVTVAIVIICLSFSSAGSQPAPGGGAPLIVGTWKLNAEKSNVRLAPDAINIRQYTMRPDGFLVGLLITGNTQAYHYLQFTAKSDGKDYPEYSDQIVADMIAAGRPTSRTYAEVVVDEYTTEWTDKADGRIIGHHDYHERDVPTDHLRSTVIDRTRLNEPGLSAWPVLIFSLRASHLRPRTRVTADPSNIMLVRNVAWIVPGTAYAFYPANQIKAILNWQSLLKR